MLLDDPMMMLIVMIFLQLKTLRH